MGDKERSSTSLAPLKALVVLLLIACVAVSAVTLVYVMKIHGEGCKVDWPTDDAKEETKRQIDTSTCHDIAIVGAGIGGAYSAYKLRTKNLSIAIYEQLDRVGGKAFSISIPGVDAKAELGPMRFLETHDRSVNLMKELGVETREFTRSKENDRIYFLRGQHFTQPELITKKLPYELRDDEEGKYFKGIFAEANKKIFGGIKAANPLETNATDGTPLWKLNYWDEASKHVSSDAMRYAIDAYSYDIQDLNMDFTGLAKLQTDGTSSHGDYKTITEGFQSLVEKTIDKFLEASEKHSLHLNHQVQILEQADVEDEKIYHLKIKEMKSNSKELKTVCAKKIVLALPTPALKKLHWEDKIKGQRFVDYVDAVDPYRAFKAFFAYDRPWWRTDGNAQAFRNADHVKHITTDLPIRQALDMEGHPEGLADNGKTLLMVSYAIGAAADKFKSMTLKEIDVHENAIKTDPGQYTNKKMVDLVNNYFSRIFNISAENLTQPYAVVSQYWGPDMGSAAWHYWRPGYRWTEVKSKIIKPGDNDEIYICGEAFSVGYQGWQEGAMQVCDEMLTYFGI